MNEKAALEPFIKFREVCQCNHKNFRDKKLCKIENHFSAVNEKASSVRNHEVYTFSTGGMNIKTSLRNEKGQVQ